MTTRVITPPSADVLTLEEACAQARIEPGMDDATITSYVKAATRHIETVFGVPMITQTREAVMDCWPEVIELTDAPVASITSLKYITSAGVETTVAAPDYVAALSSQPVRIAPAYGKTWPTATLRPIEGIAVRYVAGFGDSAASVPEPIRQAVRLLAADWYLRREDTTAEGHMARPIAHGVRALMSQWR